MRWMSLFIPFSIFLWKIHASPALVFITTGIAIVPLTKLLSSATIILAEARGAVVGGLMNATFGNATELIITLVALQRNELQVVRASLIGSIIGNVLLVLGLSAFIGGLRHRLLQFSAEGAHAHVTMMGLSVIALLTPALLARVSLHSAALEVGKGGMGLSIGVACILLLLYGGGLLFSMHTHQSLFLLNDSEQRETPAATLSSKDICRAILILAGVTVGVAIESEILVGSIGPMVVQLHLSRLFVGLILLPIIGNATEHSVAVLMAMRNRMDVSLNIAVSSSNQIAMFVAPIAVFFSLVVGHPLTILFSNSELIALAAAVVIAMLVVGDGKSHWLEGLQLLGVYAILALTFYYIG